MRSLVLCAKYQLSLLAPAQGGIAHLQIRGEFAAVCTFLGNLASGYVVYWHHASCGNGKVMRWYCPTEKKKEQVR
jgi:hypothetical protein